MIWKLALIKFDDNLLNFKTRNNDKVDNSQYFTPGKLIFDQYHDKSDNVRGLESCDPKFSHEKV